MKTFTIIFFILLSYSQSFSQWIQHPLGTTAAIERVKFLNKNTGWCCGAGGLLRKTTDGGANWISVSNPAGGKYLADLHIVDTNIVYVAGYFETILKTTNGGVNWIEIRNGPFGIGNVFLSCYFINENTGWIGGRNEFPQKIFKTTNGGITFDSTSINQASDITDIYFKNENEGLASGFIKDLYKTTNGGTSWFDSQINLPTNWPSFLRMSFVNDLTGYVPAGDGRVFKTTNFGTSWDTVSRIQGTGNNFMMCIEFVNLNTGWIGGESGLLFKTSNAGLNWLREAIGFGSYIDINFESDSIGFVCGTPGKIFKTTTAGQSVVFVSNETQLTKNFELSQNYPNPFNNETVIQFSLKEKGNYKLEVFNILGKKVETLFNKQMEGGNYKVNFTADKLPSGTYIYRLSSEKNSITKKFLLIK
ncbi:MAG: T9SS type A sorting domain-containing protein [Bacteroidetes bacterium]|nr:T9SS type A sorting domain-containing protein [Bacteroidota bacterium]